MSLSEHPAPDVLLKFEVEVVILCTRTLSRGKYPVYESIFVSALMDFKSGNTLFSMSQSIAQFLTMATTRCGPLCFTTNFREISFSCVGVFSITNWPGSKQGYPKILLVLCRYFDCNPANLFACSMTWKRCLCSRIKSSTCLKLLLGNCLSIATSNLVSGIPI